MITWGDLLPSSTSQCLRPACSQIFHPDIKEKTIFFLGNVFNKRKLPKKKKKTQPTKEEKKEKKLPRPFVCSSLCSFLPTADPFFEVR